MLELQGLRKHYGEVTALDGLDLRATPGRILGFLGPNGAGKTTCMRAVFGLVNLDGGTITWQGGPVTMQARMRFGYMPEQRGLYRRMKAGDLLAFMAGLHGVPRSAARSAASEWLARLGLADRIDDPVSELSHGNQQRVQLASALVHDPELLVLDEPFSGLDPLGVAAMSDLLADRAASGGTVVFSSHQLDLVEDLVDDVVIIAQGRHRAAGTVEDIRASVDVVNVTFRVDGDLPATVTMDGTAHPVTARRLGGGRMVLPVGTTPDRVLHELQGLGPVQQFAFEPPSLTMVFREVVGMTMDEAQAATTSHDADATHGGSR